MSVLSTLLSPQIQTTAWYKLQRRKLTLSQPKPVHYANEYNNKKYWIVRNKLSRWELFTKCQRSCNSSLHLHSLHVHLTIWLHKDELQMWNYSLSADFLLLAHGHANSWKSFSFVFIDTSPYFCCAPLFSLPVLIAYWLLQSFFQRCKWFPSIYAQITSISPKCST